MRVAHIRENDNHNCHVFGKKKKPHLLMVGMLTDSFIVKSSQKTFQRLRIEHP